MTLDNYLVDDNIEVFVCTDPNCPEHGHDWFEFTYIAEGEATHFLNGVKSTIKQGNYFFLDYNVIHSYYATTENFKVINCIFKPNFIDNSLRFCFKFDEVVNCYMICHSHSMRNISPANYILYDDDLCIKLLLDNILSEYENKDIGYFEIIRCDLIKLIINAIRARNINSFDNHDKLSSDLIKFAEENVSEKNILTLFSKERNYSTAYLSRKFKKDTGLNFSNYIQKLRLETACRLLVNTKKTVTEISYLSGYSDLKFFNKIFKKHFGITPREFRNYNS